MIRFEKGDLDSLFTANKNLGIYDLNPLFDAKQEPRYKEDATNGGGTPFDKSMVNATGNPISSNSSSMNRREYSHNLLNNDMTFSMHIRLFKMLAITRKLPKWLS